MGYTVTYNDMLNGESLYVLLPDVEVRFTCDRDGFIRKGGYDLLVNIDFV